MKNGKQSSVIYIVAGSFVLFMWYVYVLAFSVPTTFPAGKTFIINENESLKSISVRLEEEGYITSPLLFRAGISFLGKDRAIQLGGYVFDSPRSLSGIVASFVQGRPTTPLLSVTIPEGTTSGDIARLIAKALPSVTEEAMLSSIVQSKANGRLFPSTYFLLPSYTADAVVQLMLTTFAKKIAPLSLSVKIPSPLISENDVLVMASILEGEAKTEEDMKIIAGILLARMNKGMPLQVDVAMETYKKKGLPATPINNPGLVSINAVLHPIATKYFFYITGNDGKMYYAVTFDEHKVNIRKYLK